jgi:peptidoglycan/xylan/chitin deacetylase (PgdA/CDA1 family)
MPWKQDYTISDERGIADADVAWPDGNRCCVHVVIDLGPPAGPEGIGPSDLMTPEAQFGLHGGLALLREVLKRHRITATCAVPAVIAELYPDTIRSLRDDGHEIAAHGFKHEDVSALDESEERARLARTTEIIAGVVGQRPAGWFSLPRRGDKFAGGSISRHTMNLLIEAGYTYFGNSLADDAPHYWVADFASRRAILAMPYYYHFDDQFFLMFPEKGTGLEHPDALMRNWRAELSAQYRRGRLFNMTLHPYAIAWANRLHMLDAFLAHMRSLPLIWNPTVCACAQHWIARYPAQTHLRLEPSIWQDYEGSLS